VSGRASRSGARRIALDILYQADVTERDAIDVLREWRSAGEEIPDFAADLVVGVESDRAALDEVLNESAESWSVERMPAVDRSILRLATYELRSRPDVPPAVAIDEAIEAAKELSTEDSARFVNGVLGRVARDAGIGRRETDAG
jgi:transcription antitermination protein NusB